MVVVNVFSWNFAHYSILLSLVVVLYLLTYLVILTFCYSFFSLHPDHIVALSPLLFLSGKDSDSGILLLRTF